MDSGGERTAYTRTSDLGVLFSSPLGDCIETRFSVEPSQIWNIVSKRRNALETNCLHALAFTGVSIAFQLM